jgi:hypothetical protein
LMASALADSYSGNVDTMSYDSTGAQAAARTAGVDASSTRAATRDDHPHCQPVGVRGGADSHTDAEAARVDAAGEGR